MLFKVASWGLLILAWAWIVSACESLESGYEMAKPESFFALVAAELGNESDPAQQYERDLAEWEANAPNPVVRFIGRNSTYVFPSGILLVAWGYALVCKLGQSEEPAEASRTDWRQVGTNIEVGLRFLLHCLICWFFAYVTLCVLFTAIGLDDSSPALGYISFAVAIVITILDRSSILSKRKSADASAG